MHSFLSEGEHEVWEFVILLHATATQSAEEKLEISDREK